MCTVLLSRIINWGFLQSKQVSMFSERKSPTRFQNALENVTANFHTTHLSTLALVTRVLYTERVVWGVCFCLFCVCVLQWYFPIACLPRRATHWLLLLVANFILLSPSACSFLSLILVWNFWVYCYDFQRRKKKCCEFRYWRSAVASRPNLQPMIVLSA